MKRLLTLSSLLFLVLASILVTSCEEEVMSNPDVLVVSGLELAGGQQVPAVATTGGGSLDARYDKASKTLNLTFAWANLSDSVIAIYIQGPAERGAQGPVLRSFSNFSASRSGAYTIDIPVDEVTFKEAELLGGAYYINILTKSQPNGEVRGQIVFE